MARVCKSLKVASGYPHRDHRSGKARNWKPRVQILKKNILKERIQERTQQEIEREEARQSFFRNKRKLKKRK